MTSISEVKQEADCKCLKLEPTYLLSQEMETGDQLYMSNPEPICLLPQTSSSMITRAMSSIPHCILGTERQGLPYRKSSHIS